MDPRRIRTAGFDTAPYIHRNLATRAAGATRPANCYVHGTGNGARTAGDIDGSTLRSATASPNALRQDARRIGAKCLNAADRKRLNVNFIATPACASCAAQANTCGNACTGTERLGRPTSHPRVSTPTAN